MKLCTPQFEISIFPAFDLSIDHIDPRIGDSFWRIIRDSYYSLDF
jgi:hypothetical protein